MIVTQRVKSMWSRWHKQAPSVPGCRGAVMISGSTENQHQHMVSGSKEIQRSPATSARVSGGSTEIHESPAVSARVSSSTEIHERVTPPSRRRRAPRLEEVEPELQPRGGDGDELVLGWEPAGDSRFRAVLRAENSGTAARPGELVIDAESVRFVAGLPAAERTRAAAAGVMVANDAPGSDKEGIAPVGQQSPDEEATFPFEKIVSWKITRADDGAGLLDLNVGEPQRVIFETEYSDLMAITRTMLGFIEKLVDAKRSKGSANCQRVTHWLAGQAAAEFVSPCQLLSPSLPGRFGDQGGGAVWAEHRLRKRPEVLDLPHDLTATAKPAATASTSGTPELVHGVCTPQRELAVAMRAAAIASEQHSPRTAALKLAIYELDVLNKAPATSRMQQTAWLLDADKVQAQAQLVTQIATRAQSARATPSRIHAELRTQLMTRPGSQGGGGPRRSLSRTAAVDV